MPAWSHGGYEEYREVGVIEIQGVSHRYGDETVLSDIDLSVDGGEVVAIVGPSGAGKSTLSRIINLLEVPTAGRVIVDGVEPHRLSASGLREVQQEIGTVFQAAALLRRRTAAQNVALPLEYLGVTKRDTIARVNELLERVGLSERAGHYPAQLSGGQQQRVGIARALALNPRVLIADEATAGLDPKSTQSILRLLLELRREFSLTVILITHEIDVVRRIADRVLKIDGGRIVEQGRLTALLRDQHSALGEELLPVSHLEQLPAEQRAWSLTFVHENTPTDWLARAQGALGTPVHLYSANIETIERAIVGRATVGVRKAQDEDFVLRAFETLGISAKPIPPNEEQWA